MSQPLPPDTHPEARSEEDQARARVSLRELLLDDLADPETPSVVAAAGLRGFELPEPLTYEDPLEGDDEEEADDGR